MRNFSLVLIALGLASAATAQTVTIPVGYGAKEGDTYTYRLGNYNYIRQQSIYSSKLTPSGLTVIKSFSLRRDGVQHATRDYVDHKVNAEVFMSNNPKDPAQDYCAVWALNHGPDYTKVMNKTVIHWPKTPAPTSTPVPFNVTFTLTKPFTCTGKALVVEWLTSKFSSTDPDWQYWYPDGISTYVSGAYPTGGVRANLGTGCPTTFDHLATTPYIGNRWHSYGNTRIASQATPCLLVVGCSDTVWGAMNLPFDLTGLGAPKCNLYTDFIFGMAGVADKASKDGRVDFEKGVVPFEAGLVGMNYYEQIIAVDPAYNSLGLRFSRGSKLTIGSGFQKAMPGITFCGYRASWLPFDHSWPYAPYRFSFLPILKIN